MKKAYIIILILGSITKLSFGQKLQPNTTIQVNRSSFNIRALNHGSMVVANTQNGFINRKPKLPQSALSYFGKTDRSALLNVFTKVFTVARLQELSRENGILINFYVNPQGKVLDVSFLLDTNTLLKASEIQQLEDGIKSDVTFKLRPEETKGGDFFIITQVVKYRKVLDRSLE